MGPILIVDDEPSIRHLVGRWLVDAGHTFAEADTADAALEAMRAAAAPVVFCDIRMPGRDGLWLTRELRARYPTTAVVLATGVSDVPPSVSMQSGVLAYLVKPFRRELLLDVLAQALQWHHDAIAAGGHHHDAATLEQWLDTLENP